LSSPFSPAQPSSGILLEIVRTQTEIAKLGLDLGGVMAFVTERVQQMTGANGAVVELAEGDEMVYRTGSGIAAKQLGLRLKRQGSLSGLCVERGRFSAARIPNPTSGSIARPAAASVCVRWS